MLTDQFRNLVFEGGGIRGIAYAGVLETLEKQGYLKSVQRMAGTSAGAITATLVSLGAGSDDVAEIVGGTSFRKFLDDSFGMIRDLDQFIHEYGWYKGDSFAQWMKKQIYALGDNADLDFRGLAALVQKEPKRFRELYLIGSNFSLGLPQVFSAQETPDMPIWQAVRISMSIPLFFASVKRQGEVHVDGGVTWNYPLDLFDSRTYVPDPAHYTVPDYPTRYHKEHVYNKETLGFRLDTQDEIRAEMQDWRSPPRKIEDILDYSKALIGFMMDTANKMHLHENDWHRTVFVDTKGVKTTDFDISDQKVEELIQSGRDGTTKYLDWFENPKSAPLNRIKAPEGVKKKPK